MLIISIRKGIYKCVISESPRIRAVSRVATFDFEIGNHQSGAARTQDIKASVPARSGICTKYISIVIWC